MGGGQIMYKAGSTGRRQGVPLEGTVPLTHHRQKDTLTVTTVMLIMELVGIRVGITAVRTMANLPTSEDRNTVGVGARDEEDQRVAVAQTPHGYVELKRREFVLV